MSEFRNAGLAIEAASRTRLERRQAAERQRDIAVAEAHAGFHPSTETPEASRVRAKAVAHADAVYFAELVKIDANYERDVAQHEEAQRRSLHGERDPNAAPVFIDRLGLAL